MLDREAEALVQELLRSDSRRDLTGMMIEGGGLDGSGSAAVAGVEASAGVFSDGGDPVLGASNSSVNLAGGTQAQQTSLVRQLPDSPAEGDWRPRTRTRFDAEAKERGVIKPRSMRERRRRDKISEGLQQLRRTLPAGAVGPQIDTAAMIDVAISHITNLQAGSDSSSGNKGTNDREDSDSKRRIDADEAREQQDGLIIEERRANASIRRYRISLSEGAVSVVEPPSSSIPPAAPGASNEDDNNGGRTDPARSGRPLSRNPLPSLPPNLPHPPPAPPHFPPPPTVRFIPSPCLTSSPSPSLLPPSPSLPSPLLSSPFPSLSHHPLAIPGYGNSRFGSIFDEDPKQWRFVADLIGSSGAIFELATPLAPTHFLLLASLGNLTKAVAKGLKDPSARVIQTHFALQANVGEVVAKEEVYKVMAQLVGLGCGVLLLSSPYIAESYWSLVTTWAVIRSTHLAFRFKSLSVLEFDSLNFKRMSILARAHVSGATELPSVQAVNQKERLWLPRRLTSPRINLGCSLADLSVLLEQQSANRMPITELLALYRDEQHVLLMDDTGAFSVIFKQGASKGTVLRVVWQACWLQQQRRERRREHGADGEEVHSDLADRSGGSRSGGVGNSSSSSGGIGILQESLNALGSEFEGFLGKASTAGWDTNTLVAKVPPSAPLLMLEYEGFLAQETAAGWDTNTLLAKQEFEGFLAKAAAAGWNTNTLVAKVPPSAPLLCKAAIARSCHGRLAAVSWMTLPAAVIRTGEDCVTAHDHVTFESTQKTGQERAASLRMTIN
ncbi:unnamed protein product [Closterium sp. NIES-65]|nr:unnamed protein product [Closterium sp. NIES-65]